MSLNMFATQVTLRGSFRVLKPAEILWVSSRARFKGSRVLSISFIPNLVKFKARISGRTNSETRKRFQVATRRTICTAFDTVDARVIELRDPRKSEIRTRVRTA